MLFCFRFSMPFFFESNLDADINFKIPKSLLPANSKCENEEKYVSYGTFLLKKLIIYAEWAALYQNLPDWMLEKYVKSEDNISNWATENQVEIDGVSSGILD